MTDDSDRIVLLSIHVEWARAIFDGRKRFEYRRQPPAADPPYLAVLYVTNGPSEIWGETTIGASIDDAIDPLIEQTIKETPHTPDDIRRYFDGSDIGTALQVDDPHEYVTPLGRDGIEDIIPDFHPPQNFRYITPEQYNDISAVVG